MHIGIIGAGLIGASLARDFMQKNAGIVHIYDNNPDHLATAHSMGIGHIWHDNAAELARIADIIFLCVPVRCMGDTAALIAPHLRSRTIVTDTGSVKEQVIQDVCAALPAHVHFVAGHPAAGSDKAGPAAGRADLFAGKAWVLCPDATTNADAMARVKAVLKNTGARILELDAPTHDLIFAYTSHIPHILSFAAMNCTGTISREAGQDILPYAGGSFRDWVRVAGADTVMWRDIFLTNADAIGTSLDLYLAEIVRLRVLIDKRDGAGLISYIQASGAACHQMHKTEDETL